MHPAATSLKQGSHVPEKDFHVGSYHAQSGPCTSMLASLPYPVWPLYLYAGFTIMPSLALVLLCWLHYHAQSGPCTSMLASLSFPFWPLYFYVGFYHDQSGPCTSMLASIMTSLALVLLCWLLSWPVWPLYFYAGFYHAQSGPCIVLFILPSIYSKYSSGVDPVEAR